MKIKDAFHRQFERIVCALICIAGILPVWWYQWFHTGDGAAHLYCGNVLKELLSDVNSLFHQFFYLNIQPVPNTVVQAVIALLLFVFSTALVNKIIISLAVLTMCFGYFRVTKFISGEKTIYPAMIFIIIYCFPLKMGFWSFIAGLGMMMFSLTFYLKHYHQWTKKTGILFSLLLLLTWSVHFFGLAALLLGIFVFEARNLISDLLNRKKTIPVFKRSLLVLLFILPVALLTLFFGEKALSSNAPKYFSLQTLNEFFFHAEVLSNYHSEIETIITGSFFLLIALLIIASFITQTFSKNNFKWFLIALIIVFIALYYLLPDEFFAGGLINLRIYYLAVIFLAILAESLTINIYLRAVKTGIVLILVIIASINQIKKSEIFNRDLAELYKSAAQINEGGVILPLNYADESFYFNFSLYLSTSPQNLIVLDNLEAATPNSLVKWKPGVFPPAELGNFLLSNRPNVDITQYEEKRKTKVDYVLRWYWNKEINDSATLAANKLIDSLFVPIYISENNKAEIFKRK